MQSESLPIASNGRRAVAFMIDDMIVNMLLLIILSSQISAFMAQVTVIDRHTVLAFRAFLIEHMPLIIALKVLYHTVLIWQSGMTPGKYAVGIKTVDMVTGRTPSFFQAFWRASVRIVSEAFLYVGFAFAFVSPKHQTLHDRLSHCIVVNES